MELVTLSPDVMPDVLGLSTGAGWNQTAADWLALMADSPEGCIGIACDGRIVATTTLVTYERRLAWIGMVLTHPDYSRQGFARLLVSRAIEMAHEREVRTIKLDATDQGRHLYASLGFRDEQPVERWSYGPDLPSTAVEAPTVTEAGGYLLHRPGIHAHYLGPCVADGPETAERLFRRALREIGADHYFWDILPANKHAVALARTLGFAPVRKLTRMVLGPNPAEDQSRGVSRIWAIAGFEWG